MADGESAAKAVADWSASRQLTPRPTTPEPLGSSSRPSKYYALYTNRSTHTSPAVSTSTTTGLAPVSSSTTVTRYEHPTASEQAASASPTTKTKSQSPKKDTPLSPGHEMRSTTGHVIKTTLQNPSRKRRKDTWVYAVINDDEDGEGLSLDSRGTLTVEDEFKLAAKDAADGRSARRAARQAILPGAYNENKRPEPKRPRLSENGSKATKIKAKVERDVSGETLVAGEALDTPERVRQEQEKALDQAFDIDWKANTSVGREDDDNKPQRSESRLSRVQLVARATANAVGASVSSLGKRSREAVEGMAGRRQSTLDEHFRARARGEPSPKKIRHSIATSGPVTRLSPRGAKRGKRSSARLKDSPLKRARESIAEASKAPAAVQEKEVKRQPATPIKKKWLSAGLYVGQDPDFDFRLTDAANLAKKAAKGDHMPQRNTFLPEPMFHGKKLIELGRNFRLPFDIYCPLMERQPKPDEWKKTRRNVFIGDSASVWKKTKSLPDSCCICEPEYGCDENCLNRLMFYECDDKNCPLGREKCGNRAFADLKDRVKRGKKYDTGVEVVKTEEKGFGVRSNRTFEPNQIIVEYSGEIITQDECERRMLNEYKKNECYYLMIFHQNMIIDATRGSIARFVNHSCEPNCRMVKWTVAGEPRMALFAGDRGIMTGEELTYDYNFDPFSQKNVQKCHCGTKSCRGVLGPKPSKQTQNAEPVIAGTKRKLSQIVRGTKKEKTVLKKRRIETTSGNKMKPKVSKKRIVSKTSSEKVLIEKENMVISSSRSSSASSSSQGKPGSKSRRPTIDMLARTASKLKSRGPLKNSTKLQPTKKSTVKPFKPIGKLPFEDEDTIIVKPGPIKTATSPKRSDKGTKGVAKGMKGMKQSVKAAKLGLSGKK